MDFIEKNNDIFFNQQCKDKEILIESLKNKTFFKDFISEMIVSYEYNFISLKDRFLSDYEWLIEHSFHFRVAEKFFKSYDEELKLENMTLEEKIQYKPELKNDFLKNSTVNIVSNLEIVLSFFVTCIGLLFSVSILFFNINVIKSSIMIFQKSLILLISIPINIVVMFLTCSFIYIFWYTIKTSNYTKKIMKIYSKEKYV